MGNTEEIIYYLDYGEFEVDYLDVKAANDAVHEARKNIKKSWKEYERALCNAKKINDQYIKQLSRK